jgi:hypothetical protein
MSSDNHIHQGTMSAGKTKTSSLSKLFMPSECLSLGPLLPWQSPICFCHLFQNFIKSGIYQFHTLMYLVNETMLFCLVPFTWRNYSESYSCCRISALLLFVATFKPTVFI